MSDLRTPREYFDHVYADDVDPWGFRTRWYERRKQALTMAALPAERYRRAFEPGCAVGALTVALAGRCDQVLAVDLHPRAAAAAAEAVEASGLDNVQVQVMDVVTEWPAGPFDLVVLSEIGYYVAGAARARLLRSVGRSLEPGGTVVACHWRRDEPDHRGDGAGVHRDIGADPAVRRVVHHEDEHFLLDVWVRRPEREAG